MNIMKTSGKPIAVAARQGGAILVFCLIFLAVLTTLGVSGMESTILEERMSGNMRDYSMAFQAAESGLTDAETWLNVQTNLPIKSLDGSTPVWTVNAMDPTPVDAFPWWKSRTTGAWWTANGRAVPGFSAGSLSAAPSFLVEELATATTGQSIGIGAGESSAPRTFHRITSRGQGATATAVVYTQSTFVKPYE